MAETRARRQSQAGAQWRRPGPTEGLGDSWGQGLAVRGRPEGKPSPRRPPPLVQEPICPTAELLPASPGRPWGLHF